MTCRHEHRALCGKYDREASYYAPWDGDEDEIIVGTFVAWQCTDCGAILPDPVDDADLYRDDLPALDLDAHYAVVQANVNRAFPDDAQASALLFLAGAIR